MNAGGLLSGTADVGGHVTEGRLPARTTMFGILRWCMLVLWILVMTVAVSVGSRTGQLSDLESDLNAGSVTSVRITPGMPPGSEGVKLQSVFWRSGLLNHRADVLMTTPGDNSATSPSDDDIAVRSGNDIAKQLAGENSDLLIMRIPEHSSSGVVFGFDVPVWLFGFAFAGAAGTLMVLMSGPPPWRATRWAWFWIIPTVIGAPLFLVLAGPTPLIPTPREQHWKLTGGWAFVAALLLHSVL